MFLHELDIAKERGHSELTIKLMKQAFDFAKREDDIKLIAKVRVLYSVFSRTRIDCQSPQTSQILTTTNSCSHSIEEK